MDQKCISRPQDASRRLWSFFQDRLRASKEESQAAGPQRSTDRPGILVIDENEAVRSMLEWSLERHGFAVWSADTREHGCQLYQDHDAAIDLVLLDVNRLSWDGPRTFFALQEFNPRVRICLMSSDLGPYTKAELFQLGALAFIRKPFQLDEVVRLLWTLVSSSARTSA